MSNIFDIIVKENYFDENNKITTSEDSDEFTVVSIKNSISLENLLKLEKSNSNYIPNNENINQDNSKISDNHVNTHVQTDNNIHQEIEYYKKKDYMNVKKINELQLELDTLKIKNASLEKNIKDISGLLNSFMKINIENPKIDQIRNQLTVLVNRELRLHHAVPFMSFLSKYSK